MKAKYYKIVLISFRMPVVVTTIESTGSKKEKCIDSIIEHINEIEHKYHNIYENDKTLLCPKCEQLTTYLNNENCEKNVIYSLYNSEISNVLNICAKSNCSSNISPDDAIFLEYVSKEQQVNESSQRELTEPERNQQKDHSQSDVKLLSSSSQTPDVEYESVSKNPSSAHVQEEPSSKLLSSFVPSQNAELNTNGTFPSPQTESTDEHGPSNKLEVSVSGTTLLPKKLPDSNADSLENDGILGQISELLVTEVSNVVNYLYRTIFSGVFGYSKYEQNKKGDTDTDQIQSGRPVTTNTYSTHLRNEGARDSDTPSSDGKLGDVHNGNSPSGIINTCETNTNIAKDGIKCTNGQGMHEKNNSAQRNHYNPHDNTVASGKNSNKATVNSQSSRSSPSKELTDEKVTSVSSSKVSSAPNISPNGTTNTTSIYSSFVENAKASEDGSLVTTGTDGMGTTGSGNVLDGSDGNAQTTPYILYIVIIVVSLTIVILFILLIKYTYLSRLFSNEKRRKRKAIEDKLHKILIEPSASKEKRIQLAYNSFEN
ncbi:variable surface protein [Plasmodium gonderi]|uniref:Variable surface protein n=1 Tax=Plasmodium gonderi TaxID=77519 RepID=A0A1Y1JF11_PLAGO|nr:variable surface protein [Plasmodium gonderi]GAW79033.1 variable surface protein [Plasmodium gonderi]